MSCKYIKECPSATAWCRGEKQEFEECIGFIIRAKQRWEKEAKLQTSAAGELKIKIAEHLEDIRNSISELRQQEQTETNDMSIVLIRWKITQIQKEESWLEGLLFKPYNAQIPEEWENGIMKRFERVE